MNRRAFILGVLACLSWSTVFVLGKLTIGRHDTDPVVLGLYRFGISGVVLATIVVARGQGRKLAAIRREPLAFLALGLTGGFGMGFLVFLALQQTTSITVQIIMNSNPVLIVPLSLLIGERVGIGKVLGVVLGVAGCALVLGGVPEDVVRLEQGHLAGGVLAGLSGLCWAVYTVLGRRVVARHGALTTTTLSMLLGGVFFLIACLVMGKGLLLGWHGAATGLFLALVPTVFGFTAWYATLEKLPANVVGPLQFLVPVGGVALALVLLDEKVTGLMALGGVLAMAGVYLSTRRPRVRLDG